MVNLQQYYLNAMGIQVWTERKNKMADQKGGHSAVDSILMKKDDLLKKWKCLEQETMDCCRCELSKSRNQVVFGVGNRAAELVIVGEAPGKNEDLQGEPFVGRGGQLLNNMLKSIGFKRETVYIANVLKCRPPGNRDPLPSEIACCTPYLKQQLSLLKPKLMVAVGRIAAQFLLGSSEPLFKMRSQLYHYGDQNIPLKVTYHPAYLLRSPREKRKAYEDWLAIKALLCADDS
jgi:DNA polymerase